MAEAALILVNCNTSAYALDAVAALKAQDLSLEIIVVDNASLLGDFLVQRIDAALGLVDRAEWEFPRETWDRLRPVRYFLRALDRRWWLPARVWTWEKA